MPGEKVFLDTNIIIYAYDVSAGAKHEIAQELLVDLWNSGLGVLSTQVLQEFPNEGISGRHPNSSGCLPPVFIFSQTLL